MPKFPSIFNFKKRYEELRSALKEVEKHYEDCLEAYKNRDRERLRISAIEHSHKADVLLSNTEEYASSLAWLVLPIVTIPVLLFLNCVKLNLFRKRVDATRREIIKICRIMELDTFVDQEIAKEQLRVQKRLIGAIASAESAASRCNRR